MRLKNMYITCKRNQEYIDKLKLSPVKRNDGSIINYKIDDYSNFTKVTNSLNNIECLQSTLKLIMGAMGIRLTGVDKDIVETDNVNKFNNSLDVLRNQIRTIVDLGNSVGFSDIEQGFDIKIPPNLTLKEMSSCIADIDKALTQCPYLNVDGERIEFKNVDVGSLWFEFLTVCTGATVILLNLGKIVDKAVQIASHLKIVKFQTKQMESLGVKNEIAKNMMLAHKEMTDSLVEKCTGELQAEINPLEPEDLQRVRLSLNLMGDWMSKGMEIYSCIEAPQEIKDLFPTQDSQKAIMEPVKQLTSTTKKEE